MPKRITFDLVPNLDSMKGFFDVVLSEFKFEDFRRVYDRLINKHHANKAFYSELQKQVMPLKVIYFINQCS